MAKVTVPAKRTKGASGQINITELVLKTPYRGSVDIQKWRNAITSAESVYNPMRVQLYELYNDLMLDGHLISVIGKRRRSIKKAPIVFMRKEKEDEAINDYLKGNQFKNMLSDLLDSHFFGHSLVQCYFDEKFSYKLIPRKHVKPEMGHVVRSESDQTGIPYREGAVWDYVIEAGEDKDLGLLLSAAQYVIWKRGSFGDWAELGELFGRPLRKGSYNGHDAGAKDQLLTLLEQLGGAPYIVYPEGTSVEVDASGSNLTGDLYERLKNSCNDEISKVFIGSTLTTEAGTKGARSLGEVHERGEQDVFTEDQDYIVNILNEKFVDMLTKFGFKADGGKFVLQDSKKLDKKTKFEIDIKLKESGLPIDDDYLYEAYDIPKPKNYDELKAAATKPVAPAPPATDEPAPPEPPSKIPAPKSPSPSVPKSPSKAALKALFKSFTDFFGSARRETGPTAINKGFESATRTRARQLARMIQEGTLPEGMIVDEELADMIAEELRGAIVQGLGGEITSFATETNMRKLAEDLHRNIYQFSAAKTEAMLSEMNTLLVSDTGEAKSWKAFRDSVDELNIKYNRDYLKTEWNTATSSAQTAGKWSGFKDNADILPMLQYVTAGDEKVRDDHAILDGVVADINDPFWNTYYPPNDWNCRCDVIQLSNPDAPATDLEDAERFPDGLPVVPGDFAQNPGVTGAVFGKENPTMASASKEAISIGDKLYDDYLKTV
ncbi:MAG: DUF935 family protein [Chlorobium sp.]|nr:DUF935 family protein [Chlorobium sp.]